MAHDFVNFPELTNAQMALYYFDSPHKQIMEDFVCKVVKVHDGDTITLRWHERKFDFPLRFLGIDAPELKDERGHEVKSWLEKKINKEMVEIKIDKSNRVEKWGRLLGNVFFNGLDIGKEMLNLGLVKSWDRRKEGKIEDIGKVIKIE